MNCHHDCESGTPIHFNNVKARNGIVGNESANAIAKHAALHDHGHDKAFPSPSPDGNLSSHMYCLRKRDETSLPRSL